jgi:hypothetical protein
MLSDPVAFHVGVGNGREVARLELLDSLADRTRSTGADVYARRLQRRKGLWAHVAAEDGLHAKVRNRPGRLNASALGGLEILNVVDGLMLAAVGIDHHEATGPAEAGIHLRI